MNNYFTVKVKYTTQQENGTFKRVTEPYLVAAMTFSHAETRIYEELGEIIRGEFNIVSIARTELHDIFHYDTESGVWYILKIKFDGSADGEGSKNIRQTFFVAAESVKDAIDKLKESLSTLMVDYEITSSAVSPIVDIFPYREELDKEISRTPVEKLADTLKELGADVTFTRTSTLD